MSSSSTGSVSLVEPRLIQGPSLEMAGPDPHPGVPCWPMGGCFRDGRVTPSEEGASDQMRVREAPGQVCSVPLKVSRPGEAAGEACRKEGVRPKVVGYQWREDLGSGSGEDVSGSVTSRNSFAHSSPSGLATGANSLMSIGFVHD